MILKKALTSGFFLLYEKFPGFGLENDKVLGFEEEDGWFGRVDPEGLDLENVLSLSLVKNLDGPALQGAAGSSGGSHWHGARFSFAGV